MAVSDVKNLTLQPTAVVEAELAPLPELPDALKAIAGVSEWWDEMRLNRARDKETLYRLLLTRSGTVSGRGGSGISRITAVNGSKLNISSTQTTNVVNVTGSGGAVADDDEDQLFLAWLAL
jgi:hypothetical protein